MASAIWRGGIPTEPEVRLLMERAKLKPGETLAHEQIEAIIGQARTAARYRTITNRWRSQMFRQHNVEIIVVGGEFRALLPGERVHLYARRTGLHVRAIKREYVRNETVPASELTQAELAIKDGNARRALALMQANQQAAQINAGSAKPTVPLPRLVGAK